MEHNFNQSNEFTQSQSKSDSKLPLSTKCRDIAMSSESRVINMLLYCYVVLDLINALSSESFDEERFDYGALTKFFLQPTIQIPKEWAPVRGKISELVLKSLERFPEFNGIDFKGGFNQS
ncbi:hypothetical protein PENTCL1PPCAC_29806 [Pristionchus entomophagus]|uniref:Uncharacterized protein n=1 Tax=Pristionchus entomophagus TaxID=358040 RepID=A0AAV5UMW4_9BILA|nr:hypothetical protein PENTCL1PPCAC_29806 [Pristionchus entomophagus]